MDRMPVCGIGDPGSIPGESTKIKSLHASGGFLFLSVLKQFSSKELRRYQTNASIYAETWPRLLQVILTFS